MKPIDIRNENWDSIQARVTGVRLAIYTVLSEFGPLSTDEISERSGIGLLTVRPRVTELCQLGLVELDADRTRLRRQAFHESEVPHAKVASGVYRVVPDSVARERFESEQAQLVSSEQRLLSI